MPLGQVVFPLRHGRPYGAGAASFTFLLAGAEFFALLYGTSRASGETLSFATFSAAALPAAYVVAAAAAGVMFFATRRRSAEVTQRLRTSPMDLEKVRASVVRQLEQEGRVAVRPAPKPSSTRSTGVAGSTRRR